MTYDNREIELNIYDLASKEEKYQIRTYLHEVGHALGLDHPEGDKKNPSNCTYQALMRQTKNSLMTFNLTYHDKYNLMKLYE